ncbi:MAG: undecaprenyl-diphosphate phosphatase [Gammaproteobacteria bacterium]|nr:undecaprenyl-diphosphate phosphatase [Gammaproteobacteria bacterium]
MTLFKVLILALIQGACELLPVSSSAHVILAEKLMGINPTAPEMTFLLVMLHTGTMFAVLAYFWKTWRERYFSSAAAFWPFFWRVVVATGLTGTVGLILLVIIERLFMRGIAHPQIEMLFGNSYIIAAGLAVVGIMIILSAKRGSRSDSQEAPGLRDSIWIGIVQGFCLPFRGFSRSGATISTGLFRNLNKERVEEFSFALAVALTPPVIAKEGYRLYKSAAAAGDASHYFSLLWPSFFGMLASFIAGLAALRLLSRWLEHNRWHWFGYYCLLVAVVVLAAEWFWH